MVAESIINSALEAESAIDVPVESEPSVSTERVERDDEMDEELRRILESRKAEIKVVGGNTISRLMQVGIVGAETVAINTDAQDLLYTDSDRKILIGKDITGGLGAGADPGIGAEAAKESKEEIKKALEGADMVFIDCGLGGGTGTGAAPVIADISKKVGALTVGIVTMPFMMEGQQRRKNAQEGLENLESMVDTLIVIPNDKLLEIVPDVSILTAFKVADEILVNAVKGIAELITKPGLVNLDFADVRAVMTSGGLAMIGMGESDSESRAVESVEKSLTNPLLDVAIDGANGALINVSGGEGVTIKECQEIVDAVNNKINPDAKIIWGAQIDKALGDSVRTMLIVTGVKSSQIYGPENTYSQQKQKEIEKVLGIDFVGK
jgi:cell division protein FtsZ